MNGPEVSKSAFRWSVRLSDSHPEKRVVVGLAVIGAAAIGWFLFRSAILTVLGSAIILGSTMEFWLGSRFWIDGSGVGSQTGLSISSIEWSAVKRVIQESGGIRLSPLEKAGTMDPFRGVLLRYGATNRGDVEKAILEFGGIRTALERGSPGIGDRGTDRETRS